MSTSEALPYLQLLTPLTFTSHVAPLPSNDPDAPLLQQHTITAFSTSPRGLFSARLEMTVNTKTMAIADLSVPKLDPAAEAELRPFIDRIVGKGDCGDDGRAVLPSSGLYHNVSVLTWAMGEWLSVAVRRARAWWALEREVGEKEGLRALVRRLRAGKQGSGKRRGARQRRDSDEDESEGEEEEEGQEREEGKCGKADLLRFMGRTCIDLEVPVLDDAEGKVSGLRVQWRIVFDWTGEARSEVGVLIGLPGKWHKHDERGQLSGLPKLFDELVQGGEDPLDAVRTIVCLMAGEQKS
ncbi:hypothetical protein VTI74DRAFT_1549 [Chaetomium olivicolor]